MAEESPSSLQGRRVVVTRAAEQSERLVLALREAGALPIVVPMVAFGPPDDGSAFDEAIRGLHGSDWLFLTSQNALRALLERSQLLKVNLATELAGVSVAAVGPATAEAAENAGLKVAFVATKHQGVSLAEELAEKLKGQLVFLPRSDKANPELVDKLNQLGAQVKEIIAYKTVRPDPQELARAVAMLREGADAILFFSPSAVQHLQDHLGNEKLLEFSRRAVFVAIGPVTEVALRQAKVERVVLARDTTVEAVVGALAEFFGKTGSRLIVGVKPG